MEYERNISFVRQLGPAATIKAGAAGRRALRVFQLHGNQAAQCGRFSQKGSFTMAAKQRLAGNDGEEAGDKHTLEDGVFRLENWLPYEFSLVANRVSAMLARMYKERYGLSVVGWRVLAILNNESPLSAKKVAERTAMNAVNVSRAVAHLADLGMVRRSTNAQDYRQVMLSPSKKGQSAYQQVIPLAMAIEQELLQGMKRADIETLRQTAIALSGRAALRLPETRGWRSLLPKKNAS